tara:strand:+ start:226 stop:639 length:414 start_codon:yes stop_codon:yes gene_type:complete
MKKPLNERFQQLAGIKPLYENPEEKPKQTNEQLLGAVAGFVGMVSAAGGMAALQMKMEDPEERKKNPKLAALLDILDELGSAASSAKSGGTMSGGVNEQPEEEVDISDLEDELGKIFDTECEVPNTSDERPEEEPEV